MRPAVSITSPREAAADEMCDKNELLKKKKTTKKTTNGRSHNGCCIIYCGLSTKLWTCVFFPSIPCTVSKFYIYFCFSILYGFKSLFDSFLLFKNLAGISCLFFSQQAYVDEGISWRVFVLFVFYWQQLLHCFHCKIPLHASLVLMIWISTVKLEHVSVLCWNDMYFKYKVG